MIKQQLPKAFLAGLGWTLGVSSRPLTKTWFRSLKKLLREKEAEALEHPKFGSLLSAIRERLGRWPKTQEEWEEVLMNLLAEEIAEKLVKGWDRYGAPTAARHPTEEGRWVGSFEGPGKPYTVEASSKREAYRLARREWVRRMLRGEDSQS